MQACNTSLLLNSMKSVYFTLYLSLATVRCGVTPTVADSSSSITLSGDTYTVTYDCNNGWKFKTAGVVAKTCGLSDSAWSPDDVECLSKGRLFIYRDSHIHVLNDICDIVKLYIRIQTF